MRVIRWLIKYILLFFVICLAGCNEERNLPKIIFCDMIYSGRDHFYVTKKNHVNQGYYFTAHESIPTIEETSKGQFRINARLDLGTSSFESFLVLFDVENNKISVFWDSDHRENEELNIIIEESSVILNRK